MDIVTEIGNHTCRLFNDYEIYKANCESDTETVENFGKVAIATLTPVALYLAYKITNFVCARLCCRRSNAGNPLVGLVKAGKLDAVKDFLKEDSSKINEVDPKLGETPLTLACQLGNVEMVSALLEEGSLDPNATNANYDQPIEICVNKMQANDLKAVRNQLRIVRKLASHTKGPDFATARAHAVFVQRQSEGPVKARLGAFTALHIPDQISDGFLGNLT